MLLTLLLRPFDGLLMESLPQERRKARWHRVLSPRSGPAFAIRRTGRTRMGMIRLQSHMAPPRIPTDEHSLECARAAVVALELVGLAAAALGRTGRRIPVNSRFEQLMPETT